MAITRVQKASTGNWAATATKAVVFGSNVVAGNLLTVVIRKQSGAAVVSSVVDTVGTTYSLIASNVTQDPHMLLYAGESAGSGANTITVTLDSAVSFFVLDGREIAMTSPTLDTSDDKAHAGGTTSLTSDAITTSGDAYIIAAASQNGGATYTAGTDYGDIANVDSVLGVQDRIATGALVGHSVPMTSNATNQYTMVVGAWVESGGGGGGSNALMLAL